ncbi:MAG: hypothetical protein ACRD3M_10285 [Thermoanaerobaculia bacterium]
MRRPSKRAAAALALAALLAPHALRGASSVKKIALVTIPATQQLKASAERVWSVLTSVDGFSALTGFKTTGDLRSFSAVGDNVAAEIWGDRGRLFVAEIVPGKELRVLFAPGGGHYFCDKRLVPSAWQGGTTLEYTDRYTDDKADAEKTAQRAVEETQRGVQAFKKLVEQP